MDKNSFNNYQKKPSYEKKLQDMKALLLDSEKCKEIAKKLSEYISDDNKGKSWIIDLPMFLINF